MFDCAATILMNYIGIILVHYCTSLILLHFKVTLVHRLHLVCQFCMLKSWVELGDEATSNVCSHGGSIESRNNTPWFQAGLASHKNPLMFN